MKLKLLMIHLFMILISAAIIYYQVDGPDLIWNMFLALIALEFAGLAFYFKNRLVRFVASFLWLFFYPNSFYMLTDIVHMHFTDKILWEPASLILYFLYLASILFGLLTGIVSLHLMLTVYPLKAIYLRGFFYIGLSLLSSLAIHVGRYARLNSWDVFLRPGLVLDEIAALWSRTALPFILGFTFLQVMCLIFMDPTKDK